MLGFDFLIDENLKAWILEINDHPSLNIYFSNEFMRSKKYLEEDICPVDLQVKTTVVTDTINLAKKKYSTIKETEAFKSLTRVHPSQGDPDPADESECVYQLCELMRKAYYSLTPLKNKAFITAQNFEKIIAKGIVASKMVKNGFLKVDLSIFF